MRRARSSAFVLLAALFAVAGACSTTTAPLGSGDDYVGEDADVTQPQQGDEPYYPDVFGRVESSYAPPPDGYAPYDWCLQCGCPAGTFCFGGGTGVETFNGDCHADAATPASGAELSVGCYPLPAGCVVEPECDCIIPELAQLKVACYPNCVDKTNIVYCPNP
jgi:hypothetical protein